jgi:hypothetical protein
MSAAALTYDDWREAVFEDSRRLYIEIEDMCTDDVHPHARAMIHEWLQDMKEAAYAGDVAEGHRIADMCKLKIADEIAWQHEKERHG